MAEIVLEPHDSVFQVELECEFDVRKLTQEELLENLLREIANPEFLEKFKNELEKIGGSSK